MGVTLRTGWAGAWRFEGAEERSEVVGEVTGVAEVVTEGVGVGTEAGRERTLVVTGGAGGGTLELGGGGAGVEAASVDGGARYVDAALDLVGELALPDAVRKAAVVVVGGVSAVEGTVGGTGLAVEEVETVVEMLKNTFAEGWVLRCAAVIMGGVGSNHVEVEEDGSILASVEEGGSTHAGVEEGGSTHAGVEVVEVEGVTKRASDTGAGLAVC